MANVCIRLTLVCLVVSSYACTSGQPAQTRSEGPRPQWQADGQQVLLSAPDGGMYLIVKYGEEGGAEGPTPGDGNVSVSVSGETSIGVSWPRIRIFRLEGVFECDSDICNDCEPCPECESEWEKFCLPVLPPSPPTGPPQSLKFWLPESGALLQDAAPTP